MDARSLICYVTPTDLDAFLSMGHIRKMEAGPFT